MKSINAVLRGLQQAIIPEIEAYWCENKPNPAYVIPTPEPPTKPRRHSRKGEASGSIKERIGNKKRKNPSTSYFYEWYEDGRKQQRYVQVRLMNQVQQFINSRRPCTEIIDFLNAQSRTTGRLHHTQEPKI